MKRISPALSCLVALLLGSGCVAFNVGEPMISERFERDEKETERLVSRMLEEVGPAVKTESGLRGGTLVMVGLDGTFLETRQSVRRSRRVRTEERRKMSFGLFPVWAEWVWRPDGAEEPRWKPPETGFEDGKPPCAPVVGIASYAVGIPIAAGIASVLVPYTTLVVPFVGDYEGVTYDNSPYPMVPFGFHRYHTRTTTVLSSDETETGVPKTSRTIKHAAGPFDVTLSVPELGFRETKIVPIDGGHVKFSLPADDWKSEVDAEIGIERKDYAGGFLSFRPDNVEILKKASGRTFRRTLRLARRGRGSSGGGTVVTNVVVIENSRPKTKPYDIRTEEPFADGRAVYLVTILDESLTKIEVAKVVEPEIKRMLRDALLAENPGADPSKVRTYVSTTFNADDSISMGGTAFSFEPVLEEWDYDPETEIGTIRIRVLSRMDAETIKTFAAANIEAIVQDKGVAVEVGKRPPPGAKYKVLADPFRNGVLTVTYKVVN